MLLYIISIKILNYLLHRVYILAVSDLISSVITYISKIRNEAGEIVQGPAYALFKSPAHLWSHKLHKKYFLSVVETVVNSVHQQVESQKQNKSIKNEIWGARAVGNSRVFGLHALT